MKSSMCLQFFKERKFYASRASKVKLVLKLLALDVAMKAWHVDLFVFFPERFLLHGTTEIHIEQPGFGIKF